MKYLKVIRAYLSSALVYQKSGKASRRFIKFLNESPEISALSPELKKRMRLYVAISFICAEWFCTLRGKKMTKKEKDFITLIGAVTPLIDDLIDEEKLSSTEIIELLERPEKSNVNEFVIAKLIYHKLQEIENPDISRVMKAALDAQDVSLAQLNPKSLSSTEIKKITYEKGGLATLLYRVVLNHPMVEGEEIAQMELGYVMQQINDAFDIYADSQNKQQTAMSKSDNLFLNYETYQNSLKRLIEAFDILDYKKSNIEEALLKISVVTSQGELCFQQLLALQGDNKNHFNVENYERKQLICDMEKPSNIWKTFTISLTFYSQIKQRLKN